MKVLFEYFIKNLILALIISLTVNSGTRGSSTLALINSQELVSRLVKSETFEKLALNATSSFLAFTFHQESLSEKQIEYEKNLMKSYQERQYITLPEKQEIANMMGLDTWEQYNEKMKHLEKLKLQLYLEFPELRALSTKEAIAVIETALNKLNILEKLAENKPLQDCLAKAIDKNNFCMAKKGWYYNLADKLCEACVASGIIVILTGALFAEVFTDGAATPFVAASWTSFIVAANVLCISVTAVAFGIERRELLNNQAACEKVLKTDNTNCFAKYR